MPDQPPAPAAPCSGPCSTTRRQLLRGTGVAVGALAGAGILAACGEERRDAESSAESAGAAGAGTVVVALADVPVGGSVAAKVGGQDVLVTQPTEGEVRAFSAVCTHEGCTVTSGDGELLCPCHQSRYALTDAEVLGGPAPEPLPSIAVEVSGTDVVLA